MEGWGGRVIPQSLLHGAGPGGVSLSRPHCAAGGDWVVLLTLPTPLTLCLARIQSPAPCALALGKHLSVRPDMWSWLALSVPLHFREDRLLLLWTELPPSPRAPGVVDAGSLCLLPQHSRETALFSTCRRRPRPSPCAWGWRTQAGSVLSRSPPGREPLSPTAD